MRTLAVLLLPLVGCSVHRDVSGIRPLPNVVADPRIAANVSVDLSGVPEEERCAKVDSTEICFAGLRSAFGKGVTPVIADHFTAVKDAPALTARFELVDFGYLIQRFDESTAARLVFKWKLEIVDANGRRVHAQAGRSGGLLTQVFQTDAVVAHAVEIAAEEIGLGLNEKGTALLAPPAQSEAVGAHPG